MALTNSPPPLTQQEDEFSDEFSDDDGSMKEYEPAVGKPSYNFNWPIRGFSTRSNSFCSDIFSVGSFRWCISICKNEEDSGYSSIYLKFVDYYSFKGNLCVYVLFGFSLVNQTNPQLTIRKYTNHKFTGFDLGFWGFPSFIPLKELREQYIVNDMCIIEAFVEVNSITGLCDVKYPSLRLEKEEKLKTKEEDEIHSYLVIKVARTENLLEQIGSVIYFDLVDHNMVTAFIFPRMKSFVCFQEEVHQKLGIPIYCQRFWLWAKRLNGTYRPFRPLTLKEQSKSIEQLRKFTIKGYGTELRLFLEVERGKDFQPKPPSEKTNDDILLFFKLYDPLKEELRYVGSFLVKIDGTPSDIFIKLKKMAGFGKDDEIMLYEEIRFEPNLMIERIDKDHTFRSCGLKDGDIICFQQKQALVGRQCLYPDVPSFLLKHMHKFQDPLFRFLEQLTEDLLWLVRDSAAPGATTATLGNTAGLMTMNMSGGLVAASSSVPNQPDVPLEEYATQLSLLQKMHFFDTHENIRALHATSGNVRAAIKRLLVNPGPSATGFFKEISDRVAPLPTV